MNTVEDESTKLRYSRMGPEDLLQMSSSFDKLQCEQSKRKSSQPKILSQDSSGIQKKQNELKRFQNDVHSDPSFLAKLNAKVRNRFPSAHAFMHSLSSPSQQQNQYSKAEFLDDLAHSSNTILLLTPRGVKINTTEQIVRYLKLETGDRAQRHEMLYRAASTKMLPLLMESLTSSDGLIRPQLSAVGTIKECSWEINLNENKAPYIVAECFLNISVPAGSTSKSNHRIEMVGALAEIFFCPGENVLTVEILHLSPGDPVSDDQLHAFAEAESSE
eukprot:scaffold2533_cov137-Cylindrotheca_fusiformis.AAC.8